MAMGASISGIRDICSCVAKMTPNTVTMMTASNVATLCWMQNFETLMGR